MMKFIAPSIEPAMTTSSVCLCVVSSLQSAKTSGATGVPILEHCSEPSTARRFAHGFKHPNVGIHDLGQCLPNWRFTGKSDIRSVGVLIAASAHGRSLSAMASRRSASHFHVPLPRPSCDLQKRFSRSRAMADSSSRRWNWKQRYVCSLTWFT